MRACQVRCYTISIVNLDPEMLMSTTPHTRLQVTQLALFRESAAPLSLWRSLPQSLRDEVIRNLARLLLSVHVVRRGGDLPNGGNHDE
jgi:hypothetical protein